MGIVSWLLGDTSECAAGRYTGDRVPLSRRGTFAQPEVGLPEGYEPPSAALAPPGGISTEAIPSPAGTITASYAYLFPDRTVARTIEVTDSVMVDVDDEGRPVGVETLDGSDWQGALVSLALRGRVRITDG